MNTKIIDEITSLNIPFEKLREQNVLITGGNGLIASNLAETFCILNHHFKLNMEIYVLCRNELKAKHRFEHLSDLHFHVIIQDVVNPLKSDLVFGYIIHAASPANPDAFNNYPVDVMNANYIGTLNMLNYCKGSNTRFVFISSSEIYGENRENLQFFDESMCGTVDCSKFRSCYPESKRAAETLCISYQKQYDSDVIIVRPAFIYGKDIISDNTRADVFFLRQALQKKDIVMYSKGEQIRSYCYINDCVTGILVAMLKGVSGEVYNIGNEECIISLYEYYSGIKLLYEPKSAPKNIDYLRRTRCVLKTDKLKKLGWKPMYHLDEGIKDIFRMV